jgi:hypothetical protein
VKLGLPTSPGMDPTDRLDPRSSGFVSPSSGKEVRYEDSIYLRVPTNRQPQAQTIDQQLKRLRKHLELRGEALSADNIFPG